MPPLRALVAAGHDVRVVVTQPDKRRGRGGALVPSPVKIAASELGIETTDRVDDVTGRGIELGVVVAFGRLIKPHVLEAVPMVNLHFSLLPRWRGAAPVERAILAGDAETGVCLMQLEEGLDTGPVYACEPAAIDGEETADELRARLVAIGTPLLVDSLARGLPAPAPQAGEPTYAAKIDPAELQLDWTHPAVHAHRVIRVGGAWTTFRGRRLHVTRAHLSGLIVGEPATVSLERDGVYVGCGDGQSIVLLTVKPEGRKEQSAADWRNGARPKPGERFGE